MRIRSLAAVGVTLAATVFAAACGDNAITPTAPSAAVAPAAPTAPASQSLLGGLGALLGQNHAVTPLKRDVPLARNQSVSKTIGILGGTIVAPGGLTVIVPPLAVAKPTNFVVTALAGANVAYEFAPHGTRFALPLVTTQDLRNTHGLNLLSLSLGYFQDATHPTNVSEVLGVGVSLRKLTAVSLIWHFSGYIFASGDEDGYRPPPPPGDWDY